MSRRRPPWLPWCAAIAATAIFTGLGVWQLDRARLKGDLVAALERGEGAPVIPLPADSAEFEALAFQRVRVVGELHGSRQFLLDNRIHEGRAGFDVLVPLERGNGDTILVDRGWVPVTVDRKPDRPIRLELTGEVEVRGRLWLPSAGLPLGPAVTANQGSWPKLATRIDYDALGRALGTELQPAVIRLDPSLPWALEPRSMAPAFGPMRHVGYSVQWFALALTVLVVTAALWRRRKGRKAT